MNYLQKSLNVNFECDSVSPLSIARFPFSILPICGGFEMNSTVSSAAILPL